MIQFTPIDATGNMAQWFRAAVSRKADIGTEVVNKEGGQYIQVKLRINPREFRAIYLDFAHGLVPQMLEYRYEMGDVQSFGTTEVTEFSQIDGAWVPSHVVVKSGHPGKSTVEGQTVYSIQSFSFDPPDESALAVDFPIGTEVVDEVAKRAYTILAGGATKEQPIFDPKLGVMMLNGKPLPSSSDTPTPLAQAQQLRQQTSETPVPQTIVAEAHSARWGFLLGGAAVALLTVIAAALLLKQKHRPS
jgi:hypothetical protein